MTKPTNIVLCTTPDDDVGRTMVGRAVDSSRIQLLHLFDEQPPVTIDFTLNAARQLRDLLDAQIDAIERERQPWARS